MNENRKLKLQIFEQLQGLLNTRIETAKRAVKSAEESRDNETKSSVGDKYETGRAMMQLEQEKNQGQLNKAKYLKKELEQIDIKKRYNKALLGSLIFTNQGIYFLSIGLGKVIIEGTKYYAISIASPVGQLLFNKEVGAKIKFQDKNFTILKIF